MAIDLKKRELKEEIQKQREKIYEMEERDEDHAEITRQIIHLQNMEDAYKGNRSDFIFTYSKAIER